MFEPVGPYHIFDGDGMLHGVDFDGRSGHLPQPLDPDPRPRGRDRPRPGRLPGPQRPDELPRQVARRRRGAGQEPGQHPHHPPRRQVPRSLGAGPARPRSPPISTTVGEWDFDGKLEGAMTAHPRLDPRTGEMFFFSYNLFAPYLTYYVADAAGALVHRVDLDLPAPVMMHDFVITEDHAVFMDSPVTFDMEARRHRRVDGPVATRERHPPRRDASPRHRRRHPLVRGRDEPRPALLERVGRRQPHRAVGVSVPRGRLRLRAGGSDGEEASRRSVPRRPATGSTSTPARPAGSRSTTCSARCAG